MKGREELKKIKILMLSSLLFIISACSFNSVETFPSVDLPYTIVDETVTSDFFEDINTNEEELTDKQILHTATIRDLTDEEATRFVERNAAQTTNILKQNYKAVEFDFGTSELLSRGKSFGRFNEDTTNFVFNETIIPDKFYQILDYTNSNDLIGTREHDEESIIYSTIYEDMKIISIINNEYAQKGLQLKTTIDDEEVYIDIESQE